MESQSGARRQLVSMTAVAGAAAVATATVLSPVVVEKAVASPAPTVVRQVQSLQVQLAAYNPVYPYAQPTGPLGLVLTIPLAAATAVALPVVRGATQFLTALRLDPRLAQQPLVLTQSLVVPVAVGAQVALSGVLGGTYVYGRFTPVQALNFFIDSLKAAIEGTIAAERNLFGLPALTARTAGVESSTHDVGSTILVGEAKAVTLSVAAESNSQEPTAPAETTQHGGPGQTITAETSTETVEDSRSLETSEPAAAPDKPTWKRPALTLPRLKVPTFKVPTLKIRAPRAGSGTVSTGPGNGSPSSAGNTDTGPKGADSQQSSTQD